MCYSTMFAMLPVLGAATGQLIEEHTLKLPTLFAIAGIVLPAVWWLSRKFAKVEDDIEDLKGQIIELQKQVGSLDCANGNKSSRIIKDTHLP